MYEKTLSQRKNDKWERCDTYTKHTILFNKKNLLRTLFLQPTRQRVYERFVVNLLSKFEILNKKKCICILKLK